MSLEFEFIGPNDKPALTLLSTPEWLEGAKAALFELGYKVHSLASHEEFASRFSQIQYQVVVAEPLFAADTPAQNISLQSLQRMPMNMRRHTVILLIGAQFQSLNAMQAFQQSVHAVINPAELATLPQILRQVVGENDLMLGIYRDTQLRIAQGKM